jgi:hypothetical protein
LGSARGGIRQASLRGGDHEDGGGDPELERSGAYRGGCPIGS